MVVELKKRKTGIGAKVFYNNVDKINQCFLRMAVASTCTIVLLACGKNPKVTGLGSAGNIGNPHANSGIAGTSSNGSASAGGNGSDEVSSLATSLQLSPTGGSWTTQDVIPLPPKAIISAYSRVLETKPTLSEDERFALGDIQLDFRTGRAVRLTPLLGVPPLSYMQTLRSVAYRVCTIQVEAELSKAVPQRWFPNGNPPTPQSLGKIYAALTGSHHVTPEILDYTTTLVNKFNAIPVGTTKRDSAAVKNTLLCMYVLTDPMVILR